MRQTLTLNDDFFDEIAQALCTGSEVSDGGAESERRRAGKALRESERRFRDLLETARLISITLDEQGNITFCNDYLLALTGWTQEEILGRNWCTLFVPPEEYAPEVLVSQLAQRVIPAHHENHILTKQRLWRFIQ